VRYNKDSNLIEYMATKALDKQQCLIRLDDTEIQKLAVIQELTGLGKTGAIRKLIRDFNTESENVKPGSRLIVDGRISKNIFVQLPIREINIIAEIDPDDGELLIFINEVADKSVDVVGFANYPLLSKASMREFYQHDILYWFNSRLYRSISMSWDIGEPLPVDRKYYDKTLAEFRTTESHLQQIFVV
jgi:hypothetical protein